MTTINNVIKLDKTAEGKNKYGIMTAGGEIELLESKIIKPR